MKLLPLHFLREDISYKTKTKMISQKSVLTKNIIIED